MSFKLAASAVDVLRAALVPAALALPLLAVPMVAQAQDETPPATEEAAPAPAEAAPAPEPVAPETVIASVGGEDITEGDLLLAAEELTAELQSVPADQRRAFLLTVLIDMKLMAGAARENGLGDTEDFTRRLAYLEDQALRRAFFNDIVETQVTEEAINAAYEELAAEFTPEPEVRARHILVETEEEANSIRAEIEGGMSFEDAAAEYGTDGTSATGGDLGYFGAGMMVPEFEEAAFAMEVGELSQPVQSQFGWHLIQLEDSRLSAAPPIEQVRQQVAQQVLYESYEAAIENIRADTEVTITDEALAAEVEAQGGL
ncbi:peptidylprolyl isomerase [Pelagibacterium luteolum]|uniref:Parvulin-like PPIase n=1 Tax=Pelagibacterium luteolum TaxID=440168 RepID=A0A1G7RP33_9HYPH|nr:peptidylprolyl isomerase [Pelagibacterium luteolum]SDG12433.1 peptidyl-prolyl cis-trans isomerase C [Pelagibacterium luteolum]